MKLGIQIRGLDEITSRFAHAGPIIDEELRNAMDGSTKFLERKIKPHTPIGVSGQLRDNIKSEIRGVGAEIVGAVGTWVPYAPYVEYGTSPHWPPLKPIALWVQRKLQIPDDSEHFDATVRAVRAGIAWHGTKGQSMFEKGLDESRNKIKKLFKDAIRNVASRLSEEEPA